MKLIDEINYTYTCSAHNKCNEKFKGCVCLFIVFRIMYHTDLEIQENIQCITHLTAKDY